MRNVSVVLFVLLAFYSIVFWFFDQSPPNIFYKSISLNLANQSFFSVKLPQFSDHSRFRSLNNFFYSALLEPLKEFHEYTLLDIRYETTIVFETHLLSNRLASFRSFNCSFSYDRVHSFHFIESFNFDLTERRVLLLSDLFIPNSSYLQKLSSFCFSSLAHQYSQKALFIEEKTFCFSEEYGTWNLTPSGIFIVFHEYSVVPYMLGCPEVLIPFKDLSPFLKPHFFSLLASS